MTHHECLTFDNIGVIYEVYTTSERSYPYWYTIFNSKAIALNVRKTLPLLATLIHVKIETIILNKRAMIADKYEKNIS